MTLVKTHFAPYLRPTERYRLAADIFWKITTGPTKKPHYKQFGICSLSLKLRVLIGFLLTSLTKVLLARLLSLVGRPALEQVWGCSIFFPFPNDGAHCALGNLQHSRNWFIPFPRSIPPHNSILEFYGQLFEPHGGVSALTCTVNCGTLCRKVCLFLNHIQ